MGRPNPRRGARRDHPLRSVAIIGPNGQLGTDLVTAFRGADWTVIPATHGEVAVEDRGSVESFFERHPVDAVVNTAAFHQVAVCEKEPERSWAVNAYGARNIAAVCESLGATTVYVSTDYVFDGEIGDDSSYAEDAAVSPVNVYGASKAAGELATLSTSEANLVVRISSAFGAAGSSGKGGNFVETIVARARSGEPLAVVDDIYMSPSYTADVAARILAMIENGAAGVFHASNAGRITWNDFATEICRQIGAEVTVDKTTSDATSSPRRPRNSSLLTVRAAEIGVPERSWRDALRAYLLAKGHLHS